MEQLVDSIFYIIIYMYINIYIYCMVLHEYGTPRLDIKTVVPGNDKSVVSPSFISVFISLIRHLYIETTARDLT